MDGIFDVQMSTFAFFSSAVAQSSLDTELFAKFFVQKALIKRPVNCAGADFQLVVFIL